MHTTAETVLSLCRRRGLTLSAAESCTGGLLAACLTEVPGASQVFSGGVVSYTNGVKSSLLDVPGSLLDAEGAVSRPVAAAMAEGVRRRAGTHLALAVTGLAGPDGDDRGNPVGLVYIALAAPEGTQVHRLLLTGTRQEIRQQSVRHLLELLLRYLTNPSTEGETTHVQE